MRICIFGAGAIGGYLAVELALAGSDVRVIARGAHLEAIRDRGLTLRIAGGEKHVAVTASDNPADFGPQDFVICSLKAHQAHEHAASFVPLLDPHTAVVTAMNGIPWWYFYKSGGALDGRQIEAVDPDGRQWKIIGPERAVGCVVDSACELVAPGVIDHHGFNRITSGEPDHSTSERVKSLGAVLTAAGFDVPVRDEIRWSLWLKLWGNICFNPISVLTGAAVDRIATEPALRALCERMMLEAKAVSDAIGIVIDGSLIKRRLDNAGKVVGHKPSMLQDFERGRPLEIDALVTAVAEIGRLTGVATPTIDMVLGLVRERAEQASLHGRPATNRSER
jgi:2-dehydropantoate 2-reductase